RQDLLDFMVWLKQADTLGIQFTQEDVRTALEGLTPHNKPLTGKKTEEQKLLLTPDLFGKEAHVDLPMLYTALIDEFRVVLAQGIILGEEPGLFAERPTGFRDPLGVTPGQFVDYFNEQREGAKVVLLPVPVNEFVGPN